MAYSARILLDSLSPAGVRLTTVEVRYPRFIHSEMMTHRVFSRNAASSRAIPIKKMIATVREDPAMPIWWGKNQSGMAARTEISVQARALAELEWRRALENALGTAERLSSSEIDLHKQLVNRILEPFAWITVIITATQWSNFFTQRCHPDAQPEIKRIADLLLLAYRGSTPQPLVLGDWHTPLIQDDERELTPALRCKVSVARCARVSYLTHDGSRDVRKDLELYDRLLEGGANGHWSPFEHVATPLEAPEEPSGNLRGWKQYRKLFGDENASTFPDEVSAEAFA
ncbi:MAG TPA: FAD-dependent thymidylate synthase [Candidatus Acidoferrales bacterium]|nr:FAD-dependent thymidylate synthase [Candidatus Acidoferrales bacterium]